MYNQTKPINRERKMNLEHDEDLKQDEELYALKKYVHVKKVDKKNIFKNLAEYTKERVNKRHSGYFDFLVYEKEIREKLQEGFTVQSVWYCLKKDGFIDCSLKTFQRYLNIKNEKPKKIKQTIQEDTSTEKIEDQKPEEIETEVEAKASQNQTQQIEKNTGQLTQQIEKVTENKLASEEKQTTQTVEPEKAKEQTSFENREFGKLPEGKVWKDLTDDEKDIIRKEREELRAEETRKRLAENIEANRKMREEAERNKFRHDPDAKPPGYWENRES